MKIKKIYHFMAIILLLSLILQPMQLVKVQAASGAVVTGASGSQYTLSHQYVKQLNLNTGNITITDTGYTQTNGASENWDAGEDAYVIKGQGNSSNSLIINTTNYIPTIYLLETQWSGKITLNGSASVKIIVLGNVSCSKLISMGSVSTGSNQLIEIYGYNEDSRLTVNYLFSGFPGDNSRIGKLLIDGVKITCAYITEILSVGTSGNMRYYATFLNNLIIKNSELTANTSMSDAAQRFYFMYIAANNGSISIENSIINNIVLDSGSSIANGSKSISIKNSNIGSINFSRAFSSSYMSYSNIFSITGENSVINSAIFDLNVDMVSLKNSVLKTSVMSKQKLYLDGSTAANSWTTLNIPVYSFNHSSFNSYGTNWILNQTPTDSDANDMFLKKVRFRNNPNTYILTTFQDGYTSKLLTDENGYLYPYIPRNNTNLQFQITDESGNANYGNYKLDFGAINDNDTSTSVPSVTVQPTIVTFFPYANKNIQYSFDRLDWASVMTDLNCRFSVVFPTGVRTIYLRYNGALYSVELDESGNPSEATQLKPVYISQSASNVSLLKGKEGSIFVNAKPVNTSTTLNYQWYKEGNPVEGETSNVLVFKNPSEIDEGVYTCTVSEEGVGNTTSSPITVTVEGSLPEETIFRILAQSDSRSVTEDSKEELYVIPNNSENVSYQWKKNGSDIAGASAGIYEIASIKEEDEGTYTCVLTKGAEVLTSNPIVLTVDPNPLSGDISNLQNIVDDLTARVNTLQKQLDNANNNSTSLQNTIATLTSQTTELNNQIRTLQSQIGDMSGNNADLQNQNAVLQEMLTNLQTKLDSANTDKASLLVIINELNIEISNKDAQITNLQSILDTSENENSTLRNQLTVLNTQTNNMVIQIDTLNTKVISLTSECDSLQNQLDTANVTISNLQQQILDLTSENDDLKSQLDSALHQIIKLEEQVNSLTTQHASLETQVNDLEARIVDLQNQLNEAGDDTSGLLQQIGTLTTQLNNLAALISQKDEQISYLSKQNTNLNTTIVILQTEINNAMESLSDHEGAVLQDRINQVLMENTQLKNNLSALIQEKSALLSQITFLNNLILTLHDENTSLTQQLQEAVNLISNLQNSLTSEISKGSSLQLQIDTLNKQISELELQINQSDSDKAALSQQISELQKNLADITNQLHVSNQTIEELNRQKADLNNTINNLQTQINNALSEMSEYEGNGLLEKIQDIKTKQLKITSDLNEANSLNTNLNSQLNATNAQMLSLQQQIDILANRLSDKDAQITELLALIAKKDTEITGKNTQIGNLQNQVQVLQDTLDSLSDGSDVITELTQQIDDLTSQINVLNVRIFELTGKNSNQDNLINKLNKQLDDKNSDISNLQKEIEVLRNAGGSQAEVITLQAEINKLTDKLDKAKDIIGELQKQLEKLKKNPVTTVESGDNTIGVGAPVFTMYKTIYLGYNYRVQLGNVKGEVSFQTSDNKVAKVNKNGLITSVKEGKAIITCTVGKSYIYKIVVTVADGKGQSTLNLTAPKIQTTNTPVLLMYKQVKKGSSTKLKISGLADNSEITYVNTDSKVAVISKDGTILGVNKGSTDVLVIVTQGVMHYLYYVKIRVDDGTQDTNMWEYLTAS